VSALQARPSPDARHRGTGPASDFAQTSVMSEAPEAREEGLAERSALRAESQVRSMFDRIAARYDLMNTLMSAGLHHRWRTRAADLARLGPGERALDVCCGTGDLALELKRRVGAAGEVVGLDFSEPMLERAREKSRRLQMDVEYRNGNALELPFGEASFDAATVGFGVRNLVDLRGGIAEMARVVRPGGRVVLLEITAPRRPPLSWFYSIWFFRLVPLLGAVAGQSDAYSYLPESVRNFPAAPELARLMHDLGLREVTYLLLAGGIIAIHAGTVPGDGSGVR
jgi:demethylmenaquinone methyltransferase/2-methoxy-6-polyprenyl-1,4-benzoquinol methylase